VPIAKVVKGALFILLKLYELYINYHFLNILLLVSDLSLDYYNGDSFFFCMLQLFALRLTFVCAYIG